jgi:hypothetical protein
MSPDAAAEMIDKHIVEKDWLASASDASQRLATQLFDRDSLADDFESVLKMAVLRQGDQAYMANEF